MIDKLYYYFIKTKYSEFSRGDIAEMKKLHTEVSKANMSAGAINDEHKSAIEIGLIGRELTSKFRHNDNYILSNDFIITAFIDDELALHSAQ